VSRRDIPAF
jgi:YggT family protein